MTDLDDVVARVRKRVHGNYGPQSEVVMDTTDMLELLTAYESAVRERDEAARAVRAFEALASGKVVLWEPQGYRTEWFATRDDDAEQTRHYAPDPLDAITKALEAHNA